MGKIITAPKVKNPTTGLWESVGSTDIHRVYIGSDEPTNLSVQIWIRVGTLEDGSECRTLMLRDARNSWYSPFDENMDGIVDEAENALKLGDQPSEYYATAEQIAHILNGTTVVSKAQKDENGNNISSTYATKQELNSKIINGVSLQENNITIPIVTLSTEAPENTTLLWLDTNYSPYILKFYNGVEWQGINTYQ